MKKNCWEFEKCGRQPGGSSVAQLGECPAATDENRDGMNDGKNAGRYCWRVAGTFCSGKVQGTFAAKIDKCSKCDFLKQVKEEEGSNFQM
jgi:hypothetical protein